MDNTSKPKKRKWPWIVGGFLLLAFIGSLSGVKPTGTPSEDSKQPSGQPAAVEQPKPKMAGVNDEVMSSEVAWRVTQVKNRGSVLKASESRFPSIAKSKTTSGKFIEVYLSVENRGKDLASIVAPKVLDDQNREFTDASFTLMEWLPDDQAFGLLNNLQPNLPKEVVAMYEIPTTAKGLRLKVGIWSPQYIELGQ